MGSIGAEGRCHGNRFWDAVCYNWLWCLMGYNFGCMIASDTQFDFVSDIAIYVLKRDVKLQLTN